MTSGTSQTLGGRKRSQTPDPMLKEAIPPGSRTRDRFLFIDYLRGFMVLLVVLDHAMHPYSNRFSWLWFFPDNEGSLFFEVWHLHNDAIMMPFLFFLAGMFVIPSLERRGLVSFLKERFMRLVIPFVFGVTFISPFLSYFKKKVREGLDLSFFDFWWGTYIRWEDAPFQNFVQGGFWFLYFLVVLTLTLLVLHYVIPRFVEGLGALVRFLVAKPVRGFLLVFFLSALILGLSDLCWGAHWWFGFKPVFHVRRARFIIKIFYFFLGAGVSSAGLLHMPALLKALKTHWHKWVGVAVLFGVMYMGYSLSFFEEGAYNNDLRLFLYQGGTWETAWPIIVQSAPPVLIRTTLLGGFMVSLTVMYMAVFYRFINTPKPFWISLASCSYGIYLFHEPFTLWLHYLLYGEFISSFIKFLIAGGGSLGISWLLVRKGLLRVRGLRRIL